MPEHRMRRITASTREALHHTQATRALEKSAAAGLPPGTLMARAGLSVAQLARALCPHAASIWVACGPGNNGGDGLVAATHLHQWAQQNGGRLNVVVTLSADRQQLPADAAAALQQAKLAGVVFSDTPPEHFDLLIDALLGIGPRRPSEGALARDLQALQHCPRPVLCVDVPSDLDADTGAVTHGDSSSVTRHGLGPRHTLSLLTLKPGLFTAFGRDLAGEVWLDDLACPAEPQATAWLAGEHAPTGEKSAHAHAGHKGRYGDVLVVGGQDIAIDGAGMTGAAILAARASLHAGAGRVFVALLEAGVAASALRWDPVCPELMFRQIDALLASNLMQSACVVCGCGGGSSVAAVLPRVLSSAARLVLDADALNAIANDPGLQTLLQHRSSRNKATVLTPHPLEAARLLGVSTAEVMRDRLSAAQQLAERFGAVCVLKGSGTVIAAPGCLPLINPTGNAALATAGTGDVLAGMIAAAWAAPDFTPSTAHDRVASAVHHHGALADRWAQQRATGEDRPNLTASQLLAGG